MPSYEDIVNRQETLDKLLEVLVARLEQGLIENEDLPEAIASEIRKWQAGWEGLESAETPPPDSGLADLIGIGGDAPTSVSEVQLPRAVPEYDEQVTSERLAAVADLYYIYQHERVGVFRVMLKLQELFRAGTVRIDVDEGALGLYRYDRRQVLRYTLKDRLQAYRRVFGYTNASPPAGAKPNVEFHALFTQFVGQVARFWRDKRISEVVRKNASDPSFGSVAVVRRSALDLRVGLKLASYGHVNILRVEVMQLLGEAMRILNAADIRNLFGAETAWDVIEEILKRYLGGASNTSQRKRMALAGREILRFLSKPYILTTNRPFFEAYLNIIGEYAEEWLTSERSLHTAAARQPVARLRPPPAVKKFA